MSKLIVLLTAIALLQITPGYRAQQLNSEGIHLMQQDRFVEAESQFRHAVQADPSNIDAVSNLGVAIFRQGRFAESITFFEQAVASRPQKAALHNHLAQAYVRTGRPHDAAAEMARACDLEPRNPDYRRFLGDMLSEAHDQPAAEKQLRLSPPANPSWEHKPSPVRPLAGLQLHNGMSRNISRANNWSGLVRSIPPLPITTASTPVKRMPIRIVLPTLPRIGR
jgi:Flp pilus assembly protein TadD